MIENDLMYHTDKCNKLNLPNLTLNIGDRENGPYNEFELPYQHWSWSGKEKGCTLLFKWLDVSDSPYQY